MDDDVSVSADGRGEVCVVVEGEAVVRELILGQGTRGEILGIRHGMCGQGPQYLKGIYRND